MSKRAEEISRSHHDRDEIARRSSEILGYFSNEPGKIFNYTLVGLPRAIENARRVVLSSFSILLLGEIYLLMENSKFRANWFCTIIERSLSKVVDHFTLRKMSGRVLNFFFFFSSTD